MEIDWIEVRNRLISAPYWYTFDKDMIYSEGGINPDAPDCTDEQALATEHARETSVLKLPCTEVQFREWARRNPEVKILPSKGMLTPYKKGKRVDDFRAATQEAIDEFEEKYGFTATRSELWDYMTKTRDTGGDIKLLTLPGCSPVDKDAFKSRYRSLY